MRLGDIIALSGARVAEYGGKSLNVAHDHADLVVNPNHERARKLAAWYNELIARHGQAAIKRIKALSAGDGQRNDSKPTQQGGGPGKKQQNVTFIIALRLAS